uniref:Uncharacterized protein n=2 Tax=Lygus hesperus TaxID=30085 RepID=A0A146LCN8_LYGHE
MRISSGNTNLTVQNDDALTNDLTEVDIPLNVPQNASPPAQLACRKSDFGMFVGSQPQDEVCDERGNIVQLSPQRTAMETSVGAKPESNAPLDMLESASFHEHVDRGVSKTDMRLSRKSVHFLNSSRKEDNDARCYSMNESHEEKFEVDLAPSNECVEMKLNSNFETEVSECPLPRRPSRKSCIGIPGDTDKDVEGQSKQTTNSDNNSGEFEFAIRRTKRKSTIGTRQSENYPDFDPRGPEDYDKMNITPLDGQLYESDMVPASESAETEPREAAEDIDLSQDLMNISLNDGELSESEAGKLNATSTPCKPRASCSTEPPYPDRKRNRSGTAKTPSLASDLAHDLSQEMMNISIQSDTRSPLPKKSFVEPLRKSIGRTLESRESSIGLNFHETGSNSHYFKVSENTNLKGDLEYNTRLANRNLMRSLGFTLLGSQTCWEFLLYDKVLGIKVVLPLTEFTELTRIESIDYTFYSWRLGRTIFLDRETVEFIRNRLHRHMPKEWLREECNKIGDLLKITSSLKRELELLKPLIKQLQYVKSRRPCTISNDRFSFKIINLHVLVNCEVTLDLKNSHKMSDGHITVKHINGKLDLDTVRLVFQALPSSDDDLLYRFVKCLDSETSQFLARE